LCGISGEIRYRNKVDDRVCHRLLGRLSHRGPDGAGSFLSPCGRVWLGHRRLSIIDLSDAATQPMTSRDGRYTITFNGEIYNFQDLRFELESLGYTFRSNSDTEVLLVAYEHWDKSCLMHLNGMFAFAIYDRGNNGSDPLVFFARDRAGEKPFYYKHTPDSFSFASELKAIDHSGKIDLAALNFYLALGYVPNSLCLYQGVNKLPPAHSGTYNLRTGDLNISRYWSPPQNEQKSDVDLEEFANEAQRLLFDSVRLRLIADVPVGVLLSGGLDSSLVVAAAAEVSKVPIKTFTISLNNSHLDESKYASIVAKHFCTDHEVLKASENDLEIIDQIGRFVDEPIADSSLLPSWMVSALARGHVKVALGGDGGDELFGGYGDYTSALADARRLGWIPSPFFPIISSLAGHLPTGLYGRNRLVGLKGGPLQSLIWGRPYFDPIARKRVLSKDAYASISNAITGPEEFLLSLYHTGQDPIDAMTRTHFGSILPDDFLVKVDRSSMAHGLEMRAPFLDHRLIEWAFGRLPSSCKVQNGQSRILQRVLARRLLPDDLDTNRKQGFSIPINEWLRQQGQKKINERLSMLPESLFQQEEISKLVTGLFQGRANGGRLFSLLMLTYSLENMKQP
jgi:asparagine synthase (glutamine-hydrolysing)